MATLMEREGAVREVDLFIPRFTLSVLSALQSFKAGCQDISWIAHAWIIEETLW